MPKIVDHEQRRKDIALKATEIFLEFGYKNIGMRQLCEQLGMSKSAVYHYYKSKDELFKAATESIVNFDANVLAERPESSEANDEQKIENFILIINQIAPRFFQEMKLISDYIDAIGEENIATDQCMALANQKYMSMLGSYVSNEHQAPLYTLMLGLLNHQIMLGKPLDENYVIEQLKNVIG